MSRSADQDAADGLELANTPRDELSHVFLRTADGLSTGLVVQGNRTGVWVYGACRTTDDADAVARVLQAYAGRRRQMAVEVS